jgi:hypothetical protein
VSPDVAAFTQARWNADDPCANKPTGERINLHTNSVYHTEGRSRIFPVSRFVLIVTGFIKKYVRDHLLLRTEPATNNVNDYGVKRR